MKCLNKIPSKLNNKRINCHHYSPSDGISSGICMLENEFTCLLDFKSQTPRLSHSSITDWLTCHRLYYLRNIKGISVKPSSCSTPIKLGSLWDQCVQVLAGQAGSESIVDIINAYEIDSRSVAKVRALYRAWKHIGLNINPFCECQYVATAEFNHYKYAVPYIIKGIFDRRYDTWFAETKLSSKPAWYSELFNVTPQVGLYFLLDKAMQHVVMEVTRVPDLRSTGKNDDETDEAYEERCFQDIIARPAWYFQGYNKDTKTFGTKFYRSEFNLEELKRRTDYCFFEITWAADTDDFYKNYRSCLNPGPCDYLPVCKSGDTISEEIYTIKKKEVSSVE